MARRAYGPNVGALVLALTATAACEDPARPGPDIVTGGTVWVDSDPRGGRILLGGEETGLVTPAQLSLDASSGAVAIVLDTAAFTYTYQDFVAAGPDLPEDTVAGPLTVRCTTPQCLRGASELHDAGGIRFAINAAGPLFLYEGLDRGITWPLTTSNSYVSIGMPSLAANVAGEVVALGIRNVGSAPNFWAGRPLPTVESTEPYRVRIPAWITPPGSTSETRMRGLEIVQEVSEDESFANVLHVRVTWTNISTDSIYRLLDPAVPAGGVTYTDAWLSFILDVDVGAFGESNDDLVSYDADRRLVFAYDSDFEVAGFSGGWADRPALIGLMLLEGPDALVPRLNAWPRARDFVAGVSDEAGRALLTATQTEPANHPDGRIGFAPDDEAADYILSVSVGPVELAPGESESVHFAVIIAAPVDGTYTSSVLVPAGNPLDANRALAQTAANLLFLADAVIGGVQ